MLKFSHFLGLAAESLESTPRLRRWLTMVFVGLRGPLSRVGIGLPRQSPSGVRKLGDLYRNSQDRSVRKNSGPRILIVSPRAWATHLLVDTLLAESLQLRGADPVIWTCGNQMPVCHIANTNEAPPMPCAGCKNAQDELLGSSQLSRVSSAEFTDPEALQSLRSRINAMDRDEILSHESAGLKLGDIVRDAYCWFCLTVDIPHTREALKLLRDFLLLAETTLDTSKSIFGSSKPDLVIMLNGVFTEESIVRMMCQQTGTPYVTYERAFGFNQFVFCRNQIANHYDLSVHWNMLRAVPLEDREERDLDRVLANWRQGHGAVVRYWDSPEERDLVILQSLEINSDARVLTMFTNVVWDTAMFGLDVVFSDMWAWVSSTVNMMKDHPELHLVIRIHPAEVKLTGSESRDRIIDRINREFTELPDNVSVIPPENNISSYKLLALSDTILVYTSTIGLEAAIEGRRVVMCGQTHYRGKGFTCDPADEEEYHAMLLSGSGSAQARESISTQARRYAHLFFLRHMYPLPVIEEKIMGNPRLTIDDLDELAEGNIKELDYLCDFILGTVDNLVPEALISQSNG